MDSVEKVYFVHSTYDFDSGNALSFDETTLLLRSVVKGLAKACPGQAQRLLNLPNMDSALDECIQEYVKNIFALIPDKRSVSSKDLQGYCASHPVISSWLTFCGTFPYAADEVAKQMATLRSGGVEESKQQVFSHLPLNVKLCEENTISTAPRAIVLGDCSDIQTYVPEVVVKTKAVEEKASESKTEGEEKSIEVVKPPEEPVNYAGPWQKLARAMKPDLDEQPVYREDDPEDLFEKAWVHCYSGADGVTRTAAYAGSNIVYTSGTFTLALSKASNPDDESAPGTWTQRALDEHIYPIRAMDVSFDRKLFATADIVSNARQGQAARIVVWDANTLTVINSIYTGTVEGQGVRALDFSRDGSLLLALSADAQSTVTIYNVATLAIVHSACLGDDADLRDVRFLGTNNLYVTAGAKGVTFYVDEGVSLASGGYKNYEPRKGLLQGAPVDGKQATAICAFELPDECVTGTSSGHLLFWRGRSCIQSLKAHENAISCLSYCSEARTVVSASLDGSVRTFKVMASADSSVHRSKSGPKLLKTRQLEQQSAFDIVHLDCPSRQILAFSANADASKAVVGTASGDIFEISLKASAPNGAPEPAEGEAAPEGDAVKKRFGNDMHSGALVSSPWSGVSGKRRRVTGLLACEGGFLSSGSDGIIRKWASAEGARNRVLSSITCDSGVSAMSATASLVAVALDDTLLANRQGLIQFYSLPDFKFISALEEVKSQQVKLLRFSADGNTLLIVTSPGNTGSIRIMQKSEEAWKLAKEIKLDAAVLTLDFTTDGLFIRVCDSKDQLHIYAMSKGEDVLLGDEFEISRVRRMLRGVTWATSTCPCAWDTEGLFVGLDYSHMIPKVVEKVAVPEEEKDDVVLQPGLVKSQETPALAEAEPLPLPELVSKLGIVARAQHLMLSTGRNGVVSVTRVPATQDFQSLPKPKVGRKSFKAHFGDISDLIFIGETQDRVVTVGSEDGVIIIWKVTYDTDEVEVGPTEEALNAAAEEMAANAPESFGYDSAEDEDAFDGERLTVHLTRGTMRPDAQDIAVKNWIMNCDLGTDDVVGPNAIPSQTPNDELDIEWVYGYSARQTRGSVRYDSEGRIIYPAATFGVVLEKATDAEHEGEVAQHLCQAHHDEVTCLDVHLPTGLAATAHKGHGPIYVVVWETATRQILARVNCGAVGAISAIAFTPDGRCVIIACQDADHTIKVVDWRSGYIRAVGVGGPNKVLGLAISQAVTPGKIRFIQVGVEHFRFHEYTEGSAVLSTKSGKYGSGNKKETVTCCTSLPLGTEGGNEFAVGLANGTMCVIARGERTFGGNVSLVIGGPVTAITCVPSKPSGPDEPPRYTIVCGCAGLRIKKISSELEVTLDVNLTKSWGPLQDKEYSLSAVGKIRGIKSVCVDKQARKILYGTSAGEIAEIDFESAADMNKGPLVHSHFRDGLKSLMAHPIRQECLTAGEDKTLRVWNLKTHKLMTQIILPDVCRAAAYAPNGQIIVAGLGGTVRGNNRQDPRDFDGKVAVLSYLQGVLQIVHIASDATETINCICFSPAGNKLYVGSADTNIYVYDPLDNFKLINTLKVHGEPVVTMDMSLTGEYLMSVGAEGEVVTWDLTLTAPITFTEDRWKGIQWYSRQSVQGRNSSGVYYPYHSANAVRSLAESFDHKLLATGDAFGAVSLYSNPAVQLGAPRKVYYGHSQGGISRVVFTQEDNYLLSIGSDDRCILQWRVKKSSIIPWAPKRAEEETESQKLSSEARAKAEIPLGNFADTFVLGQKDLSKKIPAALPEATELEISSPKLGVTLGMLGEAGIATYSGLGSVVTVTGRLITSLHPDRLQQKHRSFLAHTENIGAVATSTDYRFMAVGASNDGGSLCIINSATSSYLNVLANSVPGGIVAIAFSHDARYLAAIAGNERHTIYVYSTLNGWNDAVLLWNGDTSKADVKFMTFLSGGSYDFVTGDANEMKWWTIKGRNIVSESCKMPNAGLTTMTGLLNTGCLATGHADGSLYVWSGPNSATHINPSIEGPSSESKNDNNEDKEVPIKVNHPITSLNSNLRILISGSAKGIVIWNYRKEASGLIATMKNTIHLSAVTVGATNRTQMDLENGTYPNSMCSDSAGQRLLVALNTNSIYEISIDSGNSFVVAEGELQVNTTCYCAHPKESHTLVTGISSGLVKVWNLAASAREVTGVLSLDKKPPTALAFLSDNTLAIAIDRSDTGGKSGAVFLAELNANPDIPVTGGRQLAGSNSRELKIVKKIHNIGKGAVTHIRLSPDGRILACSSIDGFVYFFDVGKDYAPAGLAQCHPSIPVVAFDWSTDSAYLRAFGPIMPGDHVMKLSFFHVELGSTEPLASLKDEIDLDPIARTVTWASASSPAAFEAAGCHPAAVPGVGALKGAIASTNSMPTVTSVSVSNSILAAGYTDGSIKMFNFPAQANKFSILSQTQSSSPVKVCFLAGGSLVSISDKDGSLAVYNN